MFKSYSIPMSEGEFFVLKYLPLMPSEFVFISKFSEQDKERICPLLKVELSELKTRQAFLIKRESEMREALFPGMTVDELIAQQLRINRGKNLTESEQQKKSMMRSLVMFFKKLSL